MPDLGSGQMQETPVSVFSEVWYQCVESAGVRMRKCGRLEGGKTPPPRRALMRIRTLRQGPVGLLGTLVTSQRFLRMTSQQTRPWIRIRIHGSDGIKCRLGSAR